MSYELESYTHPDDPSIRVRIIQDTDPFDPEEGDTPVYLVHYHRNFHHHPERYDGTYRCKVSAVPFDESTGAFIDWMQAHFDGAPVRADYEDEGEVDEDEWAEAVSDWHAEHDDWAVFLVDSYIHSGVHLTLTGSVEAARLPDRQWDVSQCGAVLIKKDGGWGHAWEEDDECPLCEFGTVEVVDGEVRCRGECGATWSNTSDEGYRYVRDGELHETTWEQVAQQHIEAWNQYLSGDVWGYIIERAEECSSCGHVEYEQLDSCWGFYGADYVCKVARRAADGFVQEQS